MRKYQRLSSEERAESKSFMARALARLKARAGIEEQSAGGGGIVQPAEGSRSPVCDEGPPTPSPSSRASYQERIEAAYADGVRNRGRRR